MVAKQQRTGPRAPRLLVIYKKSSYQIYVRERKTPRIQQLLKKGDPILSHLVRAHQDHEESLQEARRVLARLGAKAVFRYRSDLRKAENIDLVVSLGGDGTLLWTSHLVGRDCPVVAVNTAPSASVGYFCAGTKRDLADVLEDALAGRLSETRISRMLVEVDGEVITSRVLNDLLFTRQEPAATCRYLIRFRGKEEEHKSSGVWVGPAAGSTAALHSAGGRVLPITSQRLQFVVREAFIWNGSKPSLTRGLVNPDEELYIRSGNRKSRVYIDGPHLARAVEIGSEIRMRLSNEPLTLLGFKGRR